jgi:membrane protein DedA with SNARE-associated domain
MPALAGTARMPYRRFLTFNVAGGVLWGVTVVLVGYLAGASYGRVEKLLGRGTALVIAALVVAVVVVWQVRRRRTE